jgi:hypothetical protein
VSEEGGQSNACALSLDRKPGHRKQGMGYLIEVRLAIVHEVVEDNAQGDVPASNGKGYRSNTGMCAARDWRSSGLALATLNIRLGQLSPLAADQSAGWHLRVVHVAAGPTLARGSAAGQCAGFQ